MTTLFSNSGLFQKIHSFWEKEPSRARSSRMALLSSWEKLLDLDDHIEWDQEDTSILLEGEKLKPFCHAHFTQVDEPRQTVLLGFDLQSNQILIDEIFPAPNPDIMDADFKLTFIGSCGVLVLKVHIVEKVYLQSQAAYLLNVISKERTLDRRSNPRIHFQKNACPQIELFIPLSDPIKGHLLDLSTNGLSMVAFAPSKPEFHSKMGECTLYFSDQVKLKLEIRLKKITHSRQPTSHTTFRIVFEKTTETQIDQLNAFIQSFKSLEHEAA